METGAICEEEYAYLFGEPDITPGFKFDKCCTVLFSALTFVFKFARFFMFCQDIFSQFFI